LIIRRVVVFPQPDGPISVMIEPRSMSRFSAATASVSAPSKRFVTSCSRMAISPMAGQLPGRSETDARAPTGATKWR
jgi:hypothetical protein